MIRTEGICNGDKTTVHMNIQFKQRYSHIEKTAMMSN